MWVFNNTCTTFYFNNNTFIIFYYIDIIQNISTFGVISLMIVLSKETDKVKYHGMLLQRNRQMSN